MLLGQLVDRLSRRPAIARYLSVDSLLLLFQLLQCLNEYIAWQQSSHSLPSPSLPPNVKRFLVSALALQVIEARSREQLIDDSWDMLRYAVWESMVHHGPQSSTEARRSQEIVDLFLIHGVPEGLAYHNFFPFTKTCHDPECLGVNDAPDERRPLTRLIGTKCVYFTREFGPIPAMSFSAQCRSCYTRYYPTYYIHEGRSTRTYDFGIPPMIHISTHTYIEITLCEQFTASLSFAWVSTTNSAKIYNNQHQAAIARFPAEWCKYSPVLDGPKVLDVFFLLALLREHDEHDTPLVLRNDAPRDVRINIELEKRNSLMVGPGQEQWAHICKRCCAVQEVDGMIRAVVTDGVTIGRPCCGVHDCQGRLPTQQHRYCREHEEMEKQCCIIGCTANVEDGHQTCSDEMHRSLEGTHDITKTALFQLRNRLEPDSIPIDASTANAKLRAQFGRRWTHNEQLCVATCGVVLGRATFYGSEAPNGVRLFLRRLFPTLRSVPRCIFYDNACGLKRILLSMPNETHFDACALPVDVFHMKSKHSESDEVCQNYCNPAQFKDLYDEASGKWRFNSSAAEMTNAWFVGFHSIVREMCQERYEFCLDEVIKQRNRALVADLARQGHLPQRLPREWLFADTTS
ncbi:hypothetical protein K474DRAFT_1594658 [Panus rudis PR-1116 ss-1]|nr:hypothetical protein K474DRAFT_1594658 [Panus rudis PR-1116 ss-1]